MKSVNISEAKTHLSRLVEEAARGEEIVIAKAGHPMVRLVACTPDMTPRKLGAMRGQIWIADDFDETPEEIIRLFEGEGKRLPGERPARGRSRRRPKRAK